MGKLYYLFTAYAVIWTALFVYLLGLGKKVSLLKKEIELLKERHKTGD